MSHKLKAAVIGVGYLGNFHAQKLNEHPDVELVAVYDQNLAQAQAVGDKLKVPVLASLDEIAKKVDFVTIAAATQAHYSLAEFFLNHHIATFVEKPIASTSEQGFKLCDISEKKNVIFSVGHIERFNPAYNILKESAADTLFLEINRLAPFRLRGADVSVLHDLMIHDLDLVQYIFNSKIKNFSVFGHQFIQKTIDDVSVRLELESGLQVTINNSRVHSSIVRNFRAIQKNRTLFVNTALMTQEILKPLDHEPFFEVQMTTIEKVDALKLELDHFVKAVKKERPVKITAREASNALKTLEEIHKKIKLYE